MSIVTFEKPKENVSVFDWHDQIWQLRQNADINRANASEVRTQGRQLRNETYIQAKWDGFLSNARLKDRVYEVSKWQDSLQRCLLAVQKEIGIMKEEKDITDQALEKGINIPLLVVSECMTIRNSRQGRDLNQDDVYKNLKQELCVIETLKSSLSQMCLSSWVQLNRLKEEESHVRVDLEDKQCAYEIDYDQLKTERSSTRTSFKTDPLRVPNTCIPLETWMEHSRSNKLRAEHEIQESIVLREAMFGSREKAYNDLKSQHDATDFAFRCRIHEMERAISELEWQHKKMVAEMTKLNQEIVELETALRDKTDVLKLAETRLENRIWRPTRELVHDEAQVTLGDQVLKIKQIQADITNKIGIARSTYNVLENNLLGINEDLNSKKNALTLDQRCVGIRARLNTDQKASTSETNRNILLNKMQDEIRNKNF